jgi:hypothetical protein
LKGFSIDGEKSLIWEYDKKYCKISKTPKSVNKICSKDFYYEQKMPDGSKTQMLEDGFQKIEKVAINIIRKINSEQKLTEYDKGCLSFYIGLLLTRGPSFRDGVHEFHKHHAEIMLQKEYESGRLPEPPAILKKHIVNNDINSVVKAEILPHVSLQYMFDLAYNVSQSLCYKRWDIYYTRNSEFFATSDTPVMFGPVDSKENREINPAHSLSLVLCPITKKILIAARPYCKSDCSSFEFMPVKDGMVEKLNELMCFNAQRFVYTPEKSQKLLEYIKKAKGTRKRFMSYRIGDAIMPIWDIEISE